MKNSLDWLKWSGAVLVSLVLAFFFVRLGIWQLNRLEQRRGENARISRNYEGSALDLNASFEAIEAAQDEFRPALVSGDYWTEEQFVLRNQSLNGELGFHLIAPLRLAGSEEMLLVNRGFIPIEDNHPDPWHKYALEGEQRVSGIVRQSQPEPDFGQEALRDDRGRQYMWLNIDIPQIEAELGVDLLDYYLQASPNGDNSEFPIPVEFTFSLDEGNHFSYALQWFSFAVLSALSVPIVWWRRRKKE